MNRPILWANLLAKVDGEQADIVSTLAQRRQSMGKTFSR